MEPYPAIEVVMKAHIEKGKKGRRGWYACAKKVRLGPFSKRDAKAAKSLLKQNAA